MIEIQQGREGKKHEEMGIEDLLNDELEAAGPVSVYDLAVPVKSPRHTEIPKTVQLRLDWQKVSIYLATQSYILRDSDSDPDCILEGPKRTWLRWENG